MSLVDYKQTRADGQSSRGDENQSSGGFQVSVLGQNGEIEAEKDEDNNESSEEDDDDEEEDKVIEENDGNSEAVKDEGNEVVKGAVKEVEEEVEKEVVEEEEEDSFDFSASLARGRNIFDTKITRKRGDAGSGEEEEEEEENEEEEEKEEDKKIEELKKPEKEVRFDIKESSTSNNRSQTNEDTSVNRCDKNSPTLHDSQSTTQNDDLTNTATAPSMLEVEGKLRMSKKRARSSNDVRGKILKTKKPKHTSTGTEEPRKVTAQSNDLNDKGKNEDNMSQGQIPHRCLLFAQHRQTLDVIESCVLKRYFPTVGYKRLDGSVPPTVRAQWAQIFNSQGNNTTETETKTESGTNNCEVEVEEEDWGQNMINVKKIAQIKLG